MTRYLLAFTLASVCFAQLKSGPPLPHKVVPDWAKLPDGWNFGETSGVAVDKDDNVWVYNRGAHPVMQFDSNGRMLRSWPEVPVKSSHGIRVDEDGNIWTVDVKGHQILKWGPAGRLLMVLGRGVGQNDSKDAFNEPTGVAFAKNGDVYISDGYVNSRVVRYGKDGVYRSQWGRKGTADGEFDLVHDVAIDSGGRVYVADRTNQRIQIFDENGKFVTKWSDVGAPWGLSYVAKENAIYMCDGLNNRIVRLNLDGQITGVLSSFGKIPGKLDFAHNIAVDSAGSIYVAEIKNWRVQKFAK
ncbi:MAG TPA: peptidyl-alpha-hydroxyglycine alpha-amidating lyase family protein [Bryobacteraceae bacterium]|nr:peptidyl-alpha-hydroxyglycine alpha-amidating lyase family protein [Bryobacteraceae bacterium]